jgi:hypothetical protein
VRESNKSNPDMQKSSMIKGAQTKLGGIKESKESRRSKNTIKN